MRLRRAYDLRVAHDERAVLGAEVGNKGVHRAHRLSRPPELALQRVGRRGGAVPKARQRARDGVDRVAEQDEVLDARHGRPRRPIVRSIGVLISGFS